MMVTAGASGIWQARIAPTFAEQLIEDAVVLGLAGRTETVRAALQMLHRRAAEERMARSVDEFYGNTSPPLRWVSDRTTMIPLDPLRGEVWDLRFPSFGQQPAVILSINQLNSRLGHVAVVPITGTSGPY